MAQEYRCYFADGNDHIKTVEYIESADDAGAALKAEQLLASSSFSFAELWQGKRLVGKWGNRDGSGSDRAAT